MKIVYAIILSACFVGAENKTEFYKPIVKDVEGWTICLLYTSPSPRDYAASRMPSSA